MKWVTAVLFISKDSYEGAVMKKVHFRNFHFPMFWGLAYICVSY